jgi:hypothetical protein
MRSLGGMALGAILAAGCATSVPASQTDGPGPAPAATTGVGVVSVVGKWSSPACGTRTYERRITLDPGGTFVAEDRVSPCPPGVVCVWAGIVWTRGTYSVTGGAVEMVQLSVDAGRPPRGQPFPAALLVEGPGTLVEAPTEGERCVYTRVGP